MTLENIIAPKLEIDLFGEKWNCEFKLRNFAILKNQFKVSEDALLKGLMNKELLYIAYAIWASTIVFAPFDAADPLKVEKTMELEKVLNLSLVELQAATDQVVQAMHAYLPQPKGVAAVKKPQKAVKKTAKKTNKKATK